MEPEFKSKRLSIQRVVEQNKNLKSYNRYVTYTVDSYYDSIMYINELTDIYILLSRIHVQLRDFVAKLPEIRQFLKRISSARVR